MRDEVIGMFKRISLPRAGKLLLGTSSLSLAMTLAFAPVAHADDEPAGENLMFEKVTVTAQKREQDPQDVGIAITALNGDQLEALELSTRTDRALFAEPTVLGPCGKRIQTTNEARRLHAVQPVVLRNVALMLAGLFEGRCACWSVATPP